MDNALLNPCKRIVNASTSKLDIRVWKKITLKQVLVLIIFIILNILLTIGFSFLTNYVVGIIICLFLIGLTFGLVIKNCWFLTTLINMTKFIFSTKTKKFKELNFHKGLIILNNRKLLFFELECTPAPNDVDQANSKVEEFCEQIGIFNDFSIINTYLPFSGLNNNEEAVDKKIEEYLKLLPKNHNYEDDVVLQNLLLNKVLLKQYVEGNIKKNTYLLAFEINPNANVEVILNNIKTANANLNKVGIGINIINENTANFIKNELFLVNKNIEISRKFIKVNNDYYHFFKVDELPNYVNLGYLNFLNDLGNLFGVDINFTINSYSLKNPKKEDDIWEKAVKNAELDIEQARKRKDLAKAEADLEAADEIIKHLLDTKANTQKYEIIISIKADSKKLLNSAILQVKRYIVKKERFILAPSNFIQEQYFKAFTRNLYDIKPNVRKMRVLPTDIITYSYPFLAGNNFLDKGLYLGELFNGNPAFLSLNLGQNENNSSLIIGKTGSGKTTFLNFILKNNVSEQNVTTIVLDPKGEYADSSEIRKMNPQIISLSNDKDLVLNPFELTKDLPLKDKVAEISTYIQSWFGDAWNLSIKNKIWSAIVLADKNKKYNIEGVYEELKKIAKKDNLIDENVLILKTLSNILPDGIFNYFTKPTKVNINEKNKLIIFNLDIVLQNFNELNKIKLWLMFKFLKLYIYKQSNRSETNNHKIQILIDELPILIDPNAPFIINEIINMIRLVRSYRTSMVLAMQDTATLQTQINSSSFGKSLSALANNTEHKFIMNMNQEQLNIMKSIWGDSVELSEEENLEITTKFSHGDILYINKLNRYYFNSTDPLSKFSKFNVDNLKKEINLLLSKLIKNNSDQKGVES